MMMPVVSLARYGNPAKRFRDILRLVHSGVCSSIRLVSPVHLLAACLQLPIRQGSIFINVPTPPPPPFPATASLYPVGRPPHCPLSLELPLPPLRLPTPPYPVCPSPCLPSRTHMTSLILMKNYTMYSTSCPLYSSVFCSSLTSDFSSSTRVVPCFYNVPTLFRMHNRAPRSTIGSRLSKLKDSAVRPHLPLNPPSSLRPPSPPHAAYL